MKQLLLITLMIFAVQHAPCQSQPVREIFNLLYVEETHLANEKLQRLNLAIPEGVKDFPLLIWIGGGAWSYVDRNVEMDLARKLAAAGIGVASVGHRLSPALWRDSSLSAGIQHPAHIQDIAAAARWLHDHSADYGYDRDKIFTGGFSSGAHLATLLFMDERYLAEVGLSRSIIKGIIPISGTYDIMDYYETLANGNRPELADLHVKAVFGEDQSDFEEASPVSYLGNLSVPMLIMADHNLFNYSKIFEDRLLETDFRNFQVLYIHDLSHAELWRHISRKEKSAYREMIITFIASHCESQ